MKYVALTGLVILVAVLVVGWDLAYRNAPQPFIGAEAPQAADAAGTAPISRAIAHAHALDAQLDSIAARVFAHDDGEPVIAFVPEHRSEQDLAGGVMPAARRSGPQREVSLLFAGEDFNSAVVDGRYVRRGDRLPGGGRVLRITGNSVVIRDAGGRRVLHVRRPHRVVGSSLSDGS